MGYFPFYIELDQREGLIVGGGVTALRKIQRLLPYGPRLTVVSPEFLPEIEELPSLVLVRRHFNQELLNGKFFAIAATDDLPLNRLIAELCQKRGILVNTVDNREMCTFLFPALVKCGALSIGISTGGTSPSAAVCLKEQIAALIPDYMDKILEYLDVQRNVVQSIIPEEKQRGAALKHLCLECFRCRRPLSREETDKILGSYVKGRI